MLMRQKNKGHHHEKYTDSCLEGRQGGDMSIDTESEEGERRLEGDEAKT